MCPNDSVLLNRLPNKTSRFIAPILAKIFKFCLYLSVNLNVTLWVPQDRKICMYVHRASSEYSKCLKSRNLPFMEPIAGFTRKCSCQEELGTADSDYVFSNFDLTTLVRSETETRYSTSNNFKPKDGLSVSNLLAHFHLPLNISWLSKTYHLSLEKGILSWTDFTWFPEEADFWSLMAVVADCCETQDTLS